MGNSNAGAVTPARESRAPARGAVDALDGALLAEIHAINAAGIDLLAQRAAELTAASPPDGARGAGGATVPGTGLVLPPGPPPAAWMGLDAAQRRRLAAQPFLLLGVGLEDAARWRALVDDVLAAQGAQRIAESRPRTAAMIHARLLVHYGWHLARIAPLTAGLVAGMAAGSTAALRECRIEHLDALASRGVHWLRPRWLDAPSLWSDLLQAAQTDAAGLARTAALRAVQRVGAALAAAAPAVDGAVMPTR
ncbi:MAG: hypothetical protein R3E65_10855 [Steroidobacteraceae bacterium]